MYMDVIQLYFFVVYIADVAPCWRIYVLDVQVYLIDILMLHAALQKFVASMGACMRSY